MSDTTVIEIVAKVTDQTGDGARSATENVSKLEKSLQKTQHEIERTKKMSKLELTATLIDKASHGISGIVSKGREIAGKVWSVTVGIVDKVTAPLRGVIGGVKSMIGGIMNPILQGIGINAGMGIGSLIQGLVTNAGKTETGNIAMAATARSTGNNIDEVNAQKKAVMGLGIAEQEATHIMTKFMQGELDVAQASKLARVAQDAAVNAGTNSSEAAETMVEAINSLQPRLLRQFGLVGNLNDIYNDYADELGIVVKKKDKYGKSGIKVSHTRKRCLMHHR